MQYKINDIVFCEQRQNLTTSTQRISLESKTAEVLSYFCQHPDRIISRDELIEQVWQGQLVTDNAVTRVIAKLRKDLNDEAKSSRFIVTYPKKGYRFIASVQLVDQSAPQTTQIAPAIKIVTKPKSIFASTALSLLFTVLTVIIVSLYLWFSPSEAPHSLNARAMTRHSGDEYHGAVSPNGKYLAYTSATQGQLKLYLKDLTTEKTLQIGDAEGFSGPASWSPDGQKLVYLYTSKSSCEYRVLTLNNDQVLNSESVYQCPLGSYGKALFDHSGKKLIMTIRESKRHPYLLYQLDIPSRQLTKLNQPEAYLAGHTEFDLHPFENKLVISSPDVSQNLWFYSLDLVSGKLKTLFSRTDYTCCGIWAHDGEHIVMLGPYPASSLVSVQLDGSDESTIYNSVHQIIAPQRVRGNKGYLYSGLTHNTDLFYQAFEPVVDQQHQVMQLANSSVTDRVPAISHDGQRLAFISLRSGASQLWLQDITQDTAQRITDLKDALHYIDIQWSPDNKRIAMMSSNRIRIVDVDFQTLMEIPIEQQEIRGMSWLDQHKLSFSLNTNNQWQAYQFDLGTKNVSKFLPDTEFVYANPTYGQQVRFLSDGQVMINDKPSAIKLMPPDRIKRAFQFAMDKQRLLYSTQLDGKNRLIEYNITTKSSKTLLQNDNLLEFSFGKGGVFYSLSVETNADLFVIDGQN
jgi:transcriptional activator of cad operon